MASILTAIKFSTEATKTIKRFEKDKNFDFSQWGCDELIELRKEIREYYRKHQKAICAYCRQVVSVIYPTNSHIEHVAPKSLHPEYIFKAENLCVICSDCNQIKREQEVMKQIPDTIKKKYKTKYPDKREDFFIVHPHFDDYDEHILIINGMYVDNDSKKGNFTIGACRLNRKLSVTGWEPEVIEETELMEDFSSYIDEENPLRKGKILENIKRKLFF